MFMSINYTTKSFSFACPSVIITDEDLAKINAEIQKIEAKAKANTIWRIDSNDILQAIYHNLEIQNANKKILKIVYSPLVYSKSKQYNTTASQLTLEFFKNKKLKKFKVERAEFPNYKCYNGYSSTKVIFS